MAELPGFTKSPPVQPTVGRLIHLYHRNGDGPFAAAVTEVSISALAVFLMRPGSTGVAEVVPRGEGAYFPDGDYLWRWPPRS